MAHVVLAFSKDDTAQKVKHMLDGSAYEVSLVCHSADELMRTAAELDDVLIIMGFKIGSTLASDVAYDLDNAKVMAIVKAERCDMIENDDVFVVPLPINRERLISSIEVFRGDADGRPPKGERSEDEKKIIEKAKLYLMEKYRMDEEQAHRFIQKRSMDHGLKFVDTAKLILRI